MPLLHLILHQGSHDLHGRGRVVAAARNSHLGAEQRAGWRAPGSRTAEGDALAQSRVQGAQSRPVGTWRESTSTCGGRRVLRTSYAGSWKRILWQAAALVSDRGRYFGEASLDVAHPRARAAVVSHRLCASAVPRSADVGGRDGQDHFYAGFPSFLPMQPIAAVAPRPCASPVGVRSRQCSGTCR